MRTNPMAHRGPIVLCGAMVATAALIGCGGGDDPGGTDTKVKTKQAKDIPGPSSDELAAMIVDGDLLNEPWQLTTFEVSKAINVGDEVEPVIKGNFSATLTRTADTCRIVETINPPDLFDFDRPPAEFRYLIVEVTGRKGETMETVGIYEVWPFAGKWAGDPGFEFQLNSDQFQGFTRPGTPMNTLEAKEVIELGSPREKEFRAWYAAEKQRIADDRARKQREAEEQREREALAQRKAEAERVAGILADKPTWQGTGSLGDSFFIVFDQVDADAMTASGTIDWRGVNGESLRRAISGELAAAGSQIVLDEGEVLEGEDPGLGRAKIFVTLPLAGETMKLDWRRGRTRQTADMLAVSQSELDQRSEVAATLLNGKWAGEFHGTTGTQHPFEVKFTSVDERAGTVVVELWVRHSSLGVVHREAHGMLTDNSLMLTERSDFPDSARSWVLLNYKMSLSASSDELTGTWHQGRSDGHRVQLRLAD